MRVGLKVAAALALLMAVTTSPLQAASGTAVGVKPQAEAVTNNEQRVLTVGADIIIGDNVITGPKGQVQIKFSDTTELVVGPNSKLIIEDYLLRGDDSAGKFAINALAGTFRFATGNAAKDRYIIKTPTGTIGVRGTEFDFNVLDDGTAQVLLYDGAVYMCDNQGECVTLDGTCEVGTIDTAEAQVIGPTSEITGEERKALKQSFQYSNSQTPLNREFWFTQARQCFNAPPTNSSTPSLLEGGSGESTDEQPSCDFYECCECSY